MFKILISSVSELGGSCRLREGFPDWSCRSVHSLEFTLAFSYTETQKSIATIFSVRNRQLKFDTDLIAVPGTKLNREAHESEELHKFIMCSGLLCTLSFDINFGF